MNYHTTALLIICILTNMHLFAAAQSGNTAVERYRNALATHNKFAIMGAFADLFEQEQQDNEHMLPFLQTIVSLPKKVMHGYDDQHLKSILQSGDIIKSPVILDAVLASLGDNDSTRLDAHIVGYRRSQNLASLSLTTVLLRHMATAVKLPLKVKTTYKIDGVGKVTRLRDIERDDIVAIVNTLLKKIPKTDIKLTCRAKLLEQLLTTIAKQSFFGLPKRRSRFFTCRYFRDEKRIPSWLQPYFHGVSIQDYIDHGEISKVVPYRSDLDLSFMSINDLSGLEHIENDQITNIVLHHNKIRTITFEYFFKQTSLRSLDLSNNEISSIEIGTFANKRHLHFLWLYENPITHNQPEYERIEREIRKRPA